MKRSKSMKQTSVRSFGAGILALALITGLLFALSRQSTKAKSSTPTRKEQKLVVHEWGTFTSIAGQNGVAIDWRPLNGASDLPRFVYTLEKNQGFRGNFNDP